VSASLVGKQIGDYRITAQLGEGGMGMVYKGEHVTLGQVVAVKSLHSALMNNQAARDRFIREAQALARLNHPNIISLLNFINDQSGCFIVMEYAEGEDLEQKLQRMGLIPPEQCIPWFVQACRGLSFAHGQQIIHRDIKPSNIIVQASGQTKLLDFGTAKLVDAKRLTQQGMTLGTVIYMSKEQLLGKPLDPRSDVYSLGVTLYECVTGQLPFYDEEERKLVVKIAKTDPIPPSKHYPAISPDLEKVILKAMAKDPGDRYQTAEAFESALTDILRTASGTLPASVTAPPEEPPPAPAAPPPGPAAAAPAAAGGGGSLLLTPLFFVGAVLVILSFAGLPLMIVGGGTLFWVGLAITLVLGGLGVALAGLGFLSAPSRGAAAGQAAAGASCTSCGRAMLAGMTVCPFCNPEAAQATASGGAAPQPTPAVQTVSPGGTLNVNTAEAAERYGAAQPQVGVQTAPSRPGHARLEIVDGADKGKRFQLGAGEFTIGRHPDCQLTISDPGVSGFHAKIAAAGGQYYVEDTGSRNGVFVNNHKVGKQDLKSGDLIVIGSTRLLVTLG